MSNFPYIVDLTFDDSGGNLSTMKKTFDWCNRNIGKQYGDWYYNGPRLYKSPPMTTKGYMRYCFKHKKDQFDFIINFV